MANTVIKFVAGGGKTTESKTIMDQNNNGIYLAFNTKVVDDLSSKGILCKTIDAFFSSYIIPKTLHLIPIIKAGSTVTHLPEDLPRNMIGVRNMSINSDGTIYNRTKSTSFSLDLSREQLYSMSSKANYKNVSIIFSENQLNLTHKLRGDLAKYLICNHGVELEKIMLERFSFVIIDEAQDLKDHLELFAEFLTKINIDTYLLGDENQNINGGGSFFEALVPDKTKNMSYRCPDGICSWIREKLEIEIYGASDDGGYNQVDLTQVSELDDGKRVLLYVGKSGKIKDIILLWRGPTQTIKKAKGTTIDSDIVVVGITMNKRTLYTALTRTRKNVYCTVNKIT